jgi:hypothetical protein
VTDPFHCCHFAGKYTYRMGLISHNIMEQIPIFQMMNLARIPVLYLCKYGIFVREARIAE